ncbi:MAG: Unknown protein [uncultured Aureispira sp.]|uniref:Uncharacterized protein n=1 Tax=uncultured Aureispira sp. TaxID=1331704 RepID=A0A6S6UGI4_9BACT|nr:MAG: Unknown protein [uncultured Aureispira sp.]
MDKKQRTLKLATLLGYTFGTEYQAYAVHYVHVVGHILSYYLVW